MKIPIKVKCESIYRYSPLQCYVALRERFGSDNCYLFESLSGPAFDVNNAFVGFDKIAHISIKKDKLQISGSGVIKKALRKFAMKSKHLTPNGHSYLIEPKHTWDVLKAVHKLFALQEKTYIGFLTFLSYDAAWHTENLPHIIENNFLELPDISLVLYRGLITFDLANSTVMFEQAIIDGITPIETNTLIKAFERTKEPLVNNDIIQPIGVIDSCTKEQFISAAHSCLEHIAAGDIYQIQIGHELRISTKADPFDIYLRLRKINPSPYMYFTPFNDTYVIGASPELFVKKENTTLTMRPIAGTARRTGEVAVDQNTIATLISDEKERAEHIMLIDLCRNDLGRLCKAGTLNVNEQMIVESYSHVFHLVSNVLAELDDGLDIFDVIAATFPAGTMTGTPKIRAMELIESFESTRRNLYAGALGVISLNGDAITALCIRTALYHNGEYLIRASAGIVADSRPENEWQETLNKLAASYIAITGTDFNKSYRDKK